MLRLSVIALSLLLTGFLSASEPSEVRDSPAYHLAVIDAGRAVPTEDPSVKKFQLLLSYLSLRTRLTEEEIADKTTAVRDKLKDDHGFKVSGFDLLTNVFFAIKDSPEGALTFDNALTSVATLMYAEKHQK